MADFYYQDFKKLHRILDLLERKSTLERAFVNDAIANIFHEGKSGVLQRKACQELCAAHQLEQALELIKQLKLSEEDNEIKEDNSGNDQKQKNLQQKNPLKPYAKSLLLGVPTYSQVESQNSISFYTKFTELDTFVGNKLLIDSKEGHLMTIAPTGQGKGRGVIIPNLLAYQGQIVTVDPKGENYAVTARARRSMGHEVIKLDPFNVTKGRSDRLNPLDIFTLDNTEVETDAQMLAESVSVGKASLREPFWDLSAKALYSGLIAHVVDKYPLAERNLDSVKNLLIQQNTVKNLESILNKFGDQMNQMARQEFIALLEMPGQGTRPSVLATARSYIKAIMSDRIMQTLKTSSFDLQDFVEGKPITIYIIIPPNKLKSHQALLRLWIGTLFQAIVSRQEIPDLPTVLMLDECAQLGNFSYLETLITLCRGYGVKVWSFWQDLSQLQQLYPDSWLSLVNNCSVLQFFGAANHNMSQKLGSLIGVAPDILRDLPSDEQLLIVNCDRPKRAKKFDYLQHPQFAGSFDKNPYYAGINKVLDQKSRL